MRHRQWRLALLLLALVMPIAAQSAEVKLYRLGELVLTSESTEVTRVPGCGLQ